MKFLITPKEREEGPNTNGEYRGISGRLRRRKCGFRGFEGAVDLGNTNGTPRPGMPVSTFRPESCNRPPPRGENRAIEPPLPEGEKNPLNLRLMFRTN